MLERQLLTNSFNNTWIENNVQKAFECVCMRLYYLQGQASQSTGSQVRSLSQSIFVIIVMHRHILILKTQS